MNKFEERWLMEERDPSQRSLAERASLASRALHGLEQKDHAGWGLRAAECIAEAAKGVVDPYAPANAQQDVGEEAASAAERNKSCSCLFEDMVGALIRKGSIEAIVEAFCALAKGRAPKNGSPWERASDPSQTVFNAALGKIIMKREWAALSVMLGHDPIVNVKQLGELRAYDGEAIEFPAIERAAKLAIKICVSQILSSTSEQARRASPFLAEHLACGRKAWIETLLAPVVAAESSWGSLQALAAMRKQAQAIVACGGKEPPLKSLAASPGAARRRLQQIEGQMRSFTGKEIAGAKKFEQRIGEEIDRATARIAMESPVHAARAIMSFCSDSMGPSWKGAGLETVDAAQFLFGPRHDFLMGDGCGSAVGWGLAKKTIEDAAQELNGARLNVIDCALLLHAPREKLVELARQGFTPSEDFGRVLRLSPIEKMFGEEYLLWVESFRSKPAAKPSQRQLRI